MILFSFDPMESLRASRCSVIARGLRRWPSDPSAPPNRRASLDHEPRTPCAVPMNGGCLRRFPPPFLDSRCPHIAARGIPVSVSITWSASESLFAVPLAGSERLRSPGGASLRAGIITPRYAQRDTKKVPTSPWVHAAVTAVLAMTTRRDGVRRNHDSERNSLRNTEESGRHEMVLNRMTQRIERTYRLGLRA